MALTKENFREDSSMEKESMYSRMGIGTKDTMSKTKDKEKEP